MYFKKEIYTIWKHLRACLFVFTILTTAVSFAGPKEITVNNIQLELPYFVEHRTYADIFFTEAKNSLLPNDIELISTDPLSILIAKIKICILLGVLLSAPYFLYSLFVYISPALFFKERVYIYITFITCLLLLYSGMYFSYKYVIASMFNFLLSLHTSIDIVQYLNVNDFIDWTLSALLITGMMFQSPIIMYGLAKLNIVSRGFWFKKWRESLVVFLILSSIITPDVSGLSVLILLIPMSSLYILGAILSYLIKN